MQIVQQKKMINRKRIKKSEIQQFHPTPKDTCYIYSERSFSAA